MKDPKFIAGTSERRAFLKDLNKIAKYTGEILHGEGLSAVRERQLRKYFHKTYKMLHRLASQENAITNSSFKYGYGGKVLVRRVLQQFSVIAPVKTEHKRKSYVLLLDKEALDLELVSRIIVEVYLIRNDIEPL